MHGLIVDGLNLIRRVWAALAAGDDPPPADRAVEACCASLARLVRHQQPTHALCVMDSGQRSWRHELFPGYKANRDPMPEALAVVLPEILAAFEARGVHALERAPFEADDVIATCAVRIAEAGGRATIASTDKSFCQLLGDNIRVYDHFSDRYLDADYVRLRYDVEPRFLRTVMALTGNASVNVAGVRSVGPRTAAALVREHGDLDAILAAAGTIKGHTGAMLRADREQALLAMRLLSLRTDLELGVNLREFRYVPAAQRA